jgi:hypothetical protein
MLTSWIVQRVVARARHLASTFIGHPPQSASTMEYLDAFVAQAEYQHSRSYPCLLGVPELNDSCIIVTNPHGRSKPKSAASDPRLIAPHKP